jgi:hypothetical protein
MSFISGPSVTGKDRHGLEFRTGLAQPNNHFYFDHFGSSPNFFRPG